MAQKKEKAGKKTIVRRSKSGLGLFAGEDIKKKEFIIEYVGEVLTCKEADIRGGKYLFETSKNRFIDGSTRKNTARYINHSCAPNCEVEIERGHINVYALKNIMKGEELHYDYEKDYFDEYIKPHGCRCHKCSK